MSEQPNPYAPPVDETPATADAAGVGVELFTPSQIGWASFLASVGAGGMLILINERRLGRGSRGLWVFVVAVVLLGLVVLVESIPPMAIGVGGTLAMYFTARSMFGTELDEHLARGGRRATGGAAVGWALLGMVIALAFAFATGFTQAMLAG